MDPKPRRQRLGIHPERFRIVVMTAGTVSRGSARVKYRRPPSGRQARKIEFLERRCRHCRYGRPACRRRRRGPAGGAKMTIYGVVVELQAKKLERQPVKLGFSRARNRYRLRPPCREASVKEIAPVRDVGRKRIVRTHAVFFSVFLVSAGFPPQPGSSIKPRPRSSASFVKSKDAVLAFSVTKYIMNLCSA